LYKILQNDKFGEFENEKFGNFNILLETIRLCNLDVDSIKYSLTNQTDLKYPNICALSVSFSSLCINRGHVTDFEFRYGFKINFKIKFDCAFKQF